MKFTEIRDLTSDELRKKQTQLRDELFETRMKHSLGQVGNPIEIRDRRRSLARVLTALNLKLGSKPTAPVAKKAKAKTTKRKE